MTGGHGGETIRRLFQPWRDAKQTNPAGLVCRARQTNTEPLGPVLVCLARQTNTESAGKPITSSADALSR